MTGETGISRIVTERGFKVYPKSEPYTNSGLVAYTQLSPNHSGQRTQSIDRITPHCVVGQCSAEELGDWFAESSLQASSNYGIDRDGRVGLYVEEKNRSWCSSSNANDQRAVTIECASDTSEPYAFRDVVYRKLITLCVDICKRNGKKKLIWFGDKDKTLKDIFFAAQDTSRLESLWFKAIFLARAIDLCNFLRIIDIEMCKSSLA